MNYRERSLKLMIYLIPDLLRLSVTMPQQLLECYETIKKNYPNVKSM
jgi:hypothetical protein